MNGTVWKFTIPITDEQTVKLPHQAKVLTVEDQRGAGEELELWALVPSNTPSDWLEQGGFKERTIRICGTGHPHAPSPSQLHIHWLHLNTVFSRGGTLVWHVFIHKVTKRKD